MEKKTKHHNLKEKNIIALFIVIALTTITMVGSYFRISELTKNRCLARIQETASIITNDISRQLAQESKVLNVVAEVIALEESFDTETMQKAIQEYNTLTPTVELNLLLPNNTLISPSHPPYDVTGKLSFEEEAVLGEHITNRMTSVLDDNQMVIRHFVPVIKEGKTVALLYSTVNLDTFFDTLNVENIYKGTAYVYLIDRENGEFLMDTRHETLGNISDYHARKTKGNTSFDTHMDTLMEGKTGHVIFQPNDGDTDEYLYFYYTTFRSEESLTSENNGYNDWTIAVAVPEPEAFSNLYRIRGACLFLVIVEGIILIIYLIWSVRNTTVTLEKTVLEERLIKAENAERAKTMFLSNMSHDIRTPMNAIIGYTTLAAANIDNKERIQNYLSKILSSSNHLLSLINDVLDMSRIESGRVYIEEVECSLPDIFHDLRTILQSQMQAKQLNFFMDTFDIIDENIYCDKLHLNQVLLNLLSNAIKFTPAGGSVSLTIRQKHGAPEGYASYEIRVKDTGIGMSADFLQHVFEPFERESNTTISGIQGTGLGMAIAKNIIDMMGGTIEVKSEPGKGTEYILSLEMRLQGERKQVEVIKSLEGLRALVVDDEYSICDSVTKMLVQLGMRADWTMFGKEAVLRSIQAAELADEFSAYIIDWQLPDLNGIEVVRRIRKSVDANIPIIILTAYDWSGIEEEAREAGVTAFCNKPIFVSTLRDALLSAIDSNQPKELAEESMIPNVDENLKGNRILLVEDNELNLEIAQEILTESGFVIESACNGKIAVEMVAKSAAGYYDLILMDVQMPVMNGYEATRAIRNLENPALASIPIIAMTANAFDEDKKNAMESGMNDHTSKPLDMENLLELLHKYLDPK